MSPDALAVDQTVAGAERPGQEFLFDAFASYSSDPDGALVRDVEAFLESLADNKLVTPEHRRNLKLCVDGSDFVWPRKGASVAGSAGDQLVELIRSHMRACRRLILFTGPITSANPWVGRELDWWAENRDPADIHIAVTHGDDPVGQRAHVFPRAVLERQLDGRLWFDLRGYRRGRDRGATRRKYEEERLRLAAALLDVAPQDLIAHWREQREQERLKRRRVRMALGTAALAALGVISYGAVQLRESSGSEQAARQSLAGRRLSGEATRTIDAMALSAAALKLRPDPEASSALISAMATLPVHLASLDQESDGRAADIVRFVGNDSLILSAGYSGVARVADAASGRPVSEVRLASRPTAVAQNAPGTLVAIGTQRSLELLEVGTTGLRHRAKLKFDERVTAVTFTPDGLLLAGTFTTGRVLGYPVQQLLAGDPAPTSERRFRDENGAKVGIMGLAAVGDRLLAVGIGGEMSCGPRADAGDFRLSREHESEIFGLAGVPSASAAAFSDAKGRLILVDPSTCREINRAEATAMPAAGGRDATGRVRSGYREQRPSLGVAASADGQLLASGGFDGLARVFSADALWPVAAAVHPSRARSVALSSDGGRLAVATEGGTIELWDLRRSVEDWRLAGIEEMAVDPNGRWVAVQRDDDLLELRDLRTGRPISAPLPSSGAEPIVSPDGGLLTARTPFQSSASLWSLRAGSWRLDRPTLVRMPKTTPGEGTATMAHLLASADGLHTLDGHDGRKVRRWSRDGRPVAELRLPERGRWLSRGGGLVAVATARQALILDATSLRPIRRLHASNDVERAALSPDGRWLLVAIAGPAETNLLCRIAAPEEGLLMRIRRMLFLASRPAPPCRPLPPGQITAATFSPVGDRLALGIRGAAPDNGRLYLLAGAEDWQPRMVDDSGRVQAIAFSHDGALVAAGGTSRSIGIWSLPERKLLAELPLPNQIRTLAFVRGAQRRLVSLDGVDGVVRMWDWRPKALIKSACARWPRSREALGPSVAGATVLRSSLCD